MPSIASLQPYFRSKDQRWEKGNLINAKCVVAAPPHYLPLVVPLRPGPLL